MKQSTFKGTSDNGNIQEALEDAIQNALSNLPTTLIQWTLKEISGENGGFVNVRKVFVTIEAHAPTANK